MVKLHYLTENSQFDFIINFIIYTYTFEELSDTIIISIVTKSWGHSR